MSRFAPISPSQIKADKLSSSVYRYGFHTSTDKYAYKSGKGLTSRVVEEISSQKSESGWMRQKRLEGLKIFDSRPMPSWGADLSAIDFANLHYYLKLTDKEEKSWDDVPAEIKN